MKRVVPKFRYKLYADDQSNKDTVQDLTMLFATWAVICGASLIIQNSSIWSSVAYDTAKMLPYSPPSWGVLLCASGVLMFAGMFFGRPGVMQAGCALGAAWNFFFALSLGKSWLDGEIAFSPITPYIVVFLVNVIFVAHYGRKNAVRSST